MHHPRALLKERSKSDWAVAIAISRSWIYVTLWDGNKNAIPNLIRHITGLRMAVNKEARELEAHEPSDLIYTNVVLSPFPDLRYM